MQEREYACNFNHQCDEIGNLKRKALFNQGQQSSWISHSNEVLEVKQCAYLSSAPSQVTQHSPKLCQCQLWDDQRINGPWPPFPKRHRRRSVLLSAEGFACFTLPCSLHSTETPEGLCPLTNIILRGTQAHQCSMSHSKNICSIRSFWTPQRSILKTELTHSILSAFLSTSTPYCTTSSQVTIQLLPWPATRRECRTQPTLSKIRSRSSLWLQRKTHGESF